MSYYERGEYYQCPVCPKPYAWNWINRHLVSVHGWRYWDNERVYNPAETGEKITASAIRTLEGEVHTGHRHSMIMAQIASKVLSPCEQGFVTDKGRFVDRAEAFIIAKAANQIPSDAKGDKLFSEDVWP